MNTIIPAPCCMPLCLPPHLVRWERERERRERGMTSRRSALCQTRWYFECSTATIYLNPNSLYCDLIGRFSLARTPRQNSYKKMSPHTYPAQQRTSASLANRLARRLTSRQRIPVQSILLVRLVTLQEHPPLVQAKVAVRSWSDSFARDGGEDEGADGLVELVDAVVGEVGKGRSEGGVG